MKYLELYPDGYNSTDSIAEFFMYEKNYDEAKKLSKSARYFSLFKFC
jgi:hypothetical protein